MNIEEKVSELIHKMTLKEKIGQLNQLPINDSDELKEKIRKGEVGSVILARTALTGDSGNDAVMLQLLDDLQSIAIDESPNHIPIIYGRDIIHGFGTVLPLPLAMTASFNMELIEKGYRYVSQAAASAGVHWTFAPMLDCARDPRWGRIVEGAGEDPYLGAEIAKSVVKGFQGDNVSNTNSIAACAKHYIGYGASEGGRDYYSTDISDYVLRNYYLPAFKSAVCSGVKTVMTAFNEIGGQPVTSSKYLLTNILRDELGFEGFTVSDWDAVLQLKVQGVAETDADACQLALNAGLDMEMVSQCYFENIENLINEGKISINTLDEAVKRILRIKLECGLFDKPYTRPDMPEKTEFKNIALELAEESMVLLKNNNHTLPINKGKKIALIGPMVKEKRTLLGTWTPDYDISIVKSIEESFVDIFGEENVITCENNLYDHQRICVLESDIIVLALGESYRMSGESNSVASIELDEGQKQLVRFAHSTGKPVIILMVCARPIAMHDIEPLADAILYTWHSGTMTADAAANIVSGKVVPSGRLPVTFPAVTGQIPVYYNGPSPARDIVSGYYNNCVNNNYRDISGQYLYPFGFGLSYTEFNYSNLTIAQSTISLDELKSGSKIKVSVDVENTGSIDSKETVQLYIRDTVASMTRPMRELKAYKKLFIPQSTKSIVEFEIGFEQLAFYNGQGNFVVEKGNFEIYVGKNCLADTMINLKVV